MDLFTFREYALHIKVWLSSFPVPWNVYDHLIISGAGEELAECWVCKAKFVDDKDGKSRRISEGAFKVAMKAHKRKPQAADPTRIGGD